MADCETIRRSALEIRRHSWQSVMMRTDSRCFSFLHVWAWMQRVQHDSILVKSLPRDAPFYKKKIMLL